MSRPLEIRNGETVEPWYATPALTLLGGRLGETRQRHAGAVGLLVSLVLVVATIVWLMTR